MPSNKDKMAELQAMLDQLAASDDGADEIEFEYEGRRVRGQAHRVLDIAEAMGFKMRADPPPADDGTADDPKAPKAKPKPAAADSPVRYFGRRTG